MNTEQAVLTIEHSGGVSIWTFGAILVSPAIIAVALTIFAVWNWRLRWRDQGNAPPQPSQINMRAIKYGAVIGPICQAGMQGLVSYLTGIPVFWELTLLSVVLTGPAAIVSYKLLDYWLMKKDWRGLRETLRVRH